MAGAKYAGIPDIAGHFIIYLILNDNLKLIGGGTDTGGFVSKNTRLGVEPGFFVLDQGACRLWATLTKA